MFQASGRARQRIMQWAQDNLLLFQIAVRRTDSTGAHEIRVEVRGGIHMLTWVIGGG